MRTTIRIHVESVTEEARFTFWADSPEAPGFSAAADTVPELAKLAIEGLEFFLETDIEPEFVIAEGNDEQLGDSSEHRQGARVGDQGLALSMASRGILVGAGNAG